MTVEAADMGYADPGDADPAEVRKLREQLETACKVSRESATAIITAYVAKLHEGANTGKALLASSIEAGYDTRLAREAGRHFRHVVEQARLLRAVIVTILAESNLYLAMEVVADLAGICKGKWN